MRTRVCLLLIVLVLGDWVMGTPTPPGGPAGDPCVNCDGILWPAGSPPEFVMVELWGLVKCPACDYSPPNAIWWVQQSETDSCFWSFKDPLFYITVKLRVDYSLVTALGPPPAYPWHYFYNYREPCASSFENQHASCGGGIGSIGGKAHIYWPGP